MKQIWDFFNLLFKKVVGVSILILGICVFSLSSYAQVEEDEQRVENEQEALMQTYSETSFFYSLIDEDVSHERYTFVVTIYAPNHSCSSVWLCKSKDSNSGSFISYLAEPIGTIVPPDNSLTFQVVTTYDEPNIFLHICFYKNMQWSSVYTQEICA